MGPAGLQGYCRGRESEGWELVRKWGLVVSASELNLEGDGYESVRTDVGTFLDKDVKHTGRDVTCIWTIGFSPR